MDMNNGTAVSMTNPVPVVLSTVDVDLTVPATLMQSAATAIGNGTVLNTSSSAFAVFDVQGTFVGTVVFEYTIDGTNYYTLETVRQSDKTLQTSVTATGQFAVRVAGYMKVRARISAYTSGSITVYGRCSATGTGHHTVTIVNNPTLGAGTSTIGYTGADAAKPLAITLQTNATTNTNGTSAFVQGYGMALLQVTVTGGTALVNFEKTVDGGTTWQSCLEQVDSPVNRLGSNVSTTCVVRVDLTGATHVRARTSSVSGATVNVAGYAYAIPFFWAPSMETSMADSNNNTACIATTAYNMIFGGTNMERQRSANAISDNYTTGAGMVASGNYGWGGSTGWEKTRVANIFKISSGQNVSASSVSQFWTPTSGKKPRVMTITISSSITGEIRIRMGAAGSGTTFFTVYCEAGKQSVIYDLGQGKLATNANDVVEIFNPNGSAAQIWVTFTGTEE